MKKSFPLHAAGKDDARVRDKIRHEVNKYLRRERQKALPEGFTRWEFHCRVGATPERAEIRTVTELGRSIDDVAQAGSSGVYLEIVAVPAHRPNAI